MQSTCKKTVAVEPFSNISFNAQGEFGKKLETPLALAKTPTLPEKIGMTGGKGKGKKGGVKSQTQSKPQSSSSKKRVQRGGEAAPLTNVSTKKGVPLYDVQGQIVDDKFEFPSGPKEQKGGAKKKATKASAPVITRSKGPIAQKLFSLMRSKGSLRGGAIDLGMIANTKYIDKEKDMYDIPVDPRAMTYKSSLDSVVTSNIIHDDRSLANIATYGGASSKKASAKKAPAKKAPAKKPAQKSTKARASSKK